MISRFESYYEDQKKALEKEAKFEFNNIFSTKLFDMGFDFDKAVCEEVKKFCKKNGYEVKRVRFISFMDGYMGKVESSLSMRSDHYLKVVEGEDGNLEAVILFGSSIKAQ